LPAFIFELPARLYEVFGPNAKLGRHGQKIGLVAFKKAKQGREDHRLRCSGPQFVRPDSGQIDEPLRPTLTPKRCR
jgi:hypothetical protein